MNCYSNNVKHIGSIPFKPYIQKGLMMNFYLMSCYELLALFKMSFVGLCIYKCIMYYSTLNAHEAWELGPNVDCFPILTTFFFASCRISKIDVFVNEVLVSLKDCLAKWSSQAVPQLQLSVHYCDRLFVFQMFVYKKPVVKCVFMPDEGPEGPKRCS